MHARPIPASPAPQTSPTTRAFVAAILHRLRLVAAAPRHVRQRDAHSRRDAAHARWLVARLAPMGL